MEIVVGMLILGMVLLGWATVLTLAKQNFLVYLDQLEKDSMKLSLYSYSKELINTMSWSESWYIYLSWGYFLTWTSWGYFYDCKTGTWQLIDIGEVYSWVFCWIEVDKDVIYNYKLVE